jgi:hypothetical protein
VKYLVALDLKVKSYNHISTGGVYPSHVKPTLMNLINNSLRQLWNSITWKRCPLSDLLLYILMRFDSVQAREFIVKRKKEKKNHPLPPGSLDFSTQTSVLLVIYHA